MEGRIRPRVLPLAAGLACLVPLLSLRAGAPHSGPAAITVDYPQEGSIFPPDFVPPTFLWRDASSEAVRWRIEVTFGNGSPVRSDSAGEPLKLDPVDPRCIAPTNELPRLTPEQAAAHTWKPPDEIWSAIKKRSSGRTATVTITGYADERFKRAVSRGQVRIGISKDPVAAPIFYRDVPLMPNDDKRVVTPLARSAMGLIEWRLRYVSEHRSRLLMTGLPSCGNCHSFSNDGKILGMDVDGPGNDKGLYALAPVARETAIRNEHMIRWSTYRGRLGGKVRAAFMSQVSPDGRYVVTTILDPLTARPQRDRDPIDDKFYGVNFRDYRFLQVFYPTRGTLAWYSRETGKLQPLPGADDPQYVQTDGFWTPDGKYLVFARAPAKAPYTPGMKRAEYANDPNEAQIQYDLYRIPFNDGRGGTPERIEGASRNGMSNNFPKVSPDGKWIVFVQCRNGQLMRPDSKLWIVPFEGGKARLMRCNTPLMNSWHSFSPNGRWMVFSSKARSPYTQMYLTHIDENGNDSPPILIENSTASNRAVNIPEFVNVPPDGLEKMSAPATDFFVAFDRAAELTEKNDLDAAIPEWRKAVELNPDEDRSHFNLAVALERKGLLQEAAEHYRTAIKIEPDQAAAYANLAGILERTGAAEAAFELYRKAVEVDPENPAAQTNLAAALVTRGRTEEALEHGRLALEADPDFADGHNIVGIILARGGRLDEGILHLERAVRRQPDSLEYRFNLGRLLAARHRFADAVPHFERAAQLSQHRSPEVLAMLAAMYSELRRYSEAIETARHALSAARSQGAADMVQALQKRILEYETRARQ